ncbi:MAG: hypothetical protein LBL96_05975 [Clostridiales bacterium]|jgi:hypothetical protein|nr:hypothetical protein [Clostridiales bacterium]
MSLVKAKNKKSGITYVYESESYWDKEKKQPRNKRKLIGKINDQTGEIVATRGHARVEDSAASAQTGAELRSLCHAYKKQAASQENLIRSQADEITRLKSEKKEMARRLMELAKSYGA